MWPETALLKTLSGANAEALLSRWPLRWFQRTLNWDNHLKNSTLTRLFGNGRWDGSQESLTGILISKLHFHRFLGDGRWDGSPYWRWICLFVFLSLPLKPGVMSWLERTEKKTLKRKLSKPTKVAISVQNLSNMDWTLVRTRISTGVSGLATLHRSQRGRTIARFCEFSPLHSGSSSTWGDK